MMDMAEYRHKMAQLDSEIEVSTRPATVVSRNRSAPEQPQALRNDRAVPTPPSTSIAASMEPWPDSMGMELEAPPMEWPKPEALPDGLPPVPAFDPDLLPEALRPWVLDIAHRMQCPPDFPAVGALVALSSLVGARAVVAPKARDDWRVVPNLWGAVVGRPAVMKSPALSQAMAPLDRLQAGEVEHWKAARTDWEVDQKVADMAAAENERKAKALASKDPAAARALLQPVAAPPEPQARRFVVNDATVEKLGELMQQTPWGFLAYRDELYGLLKSLDKDGQEGARAFYLQAYDGNQGYTFDRIGRGTTHVPRVCLSLLGSIQPGKVQEYVRGAVAGGSGDDGLLQRFGLAVWPDVGREFRYVDQWPDTPAKQAAWAVYERLAALQPESDTEPVLWRFSSDAQDLFAAWMEASKTELRSNDMHPALVSHLDKYSKLVPALALLFALVDTPDSVRTVHEAELLRALAWAEFLQAHAQRLYSAATTPETTAAAALLGKIRAGKLLDSDGVMLQTFTARQVAVRGWGNLTTPEAVRKAANLLADYGWLAVGVVRSGDAKGRGRPSEVFSINPAAFSGGTA
jgi:putative DNA primase/helicase